MKTKLSIKTAPHGEHTLTRAEPAGENEIHNQLFTLKNSEGVEMGFTGEELTSLAEKWLAYAPNAALKHSL